MDDQPQQVVASVEKVLFQIVSISCRANERNIETMWRVKL